MKRGKLKSETEREFWGSMSRLGSVSHSNKLYPQTIISLVLIDYYRDKRESSTFAHTNHHSLPFVSLSKYKLDMHNFTLLTLLMLALTFTSCTENTNNCVDEELAIPCLCNKIYEPVCGCNNKTYGNACLATCSGVDTFSEGKCP